MARTAPTLTEMDIPKPQANTYKTSAATVADALQSQTAMRGHNVFRPDIYRVSEGYLA